MRYRILWGVLGALAGSSAMAHSPYLLPNTFVSTDRNQVTVQGALTEEFFTPDVALKSDAYHVIGPDGSKQMLAPNYFKDLAVLEVATPTNGTYRISTGQRLGRASKATLVNGQWEAVREGKEAPAGAKVYDVKSVTTTEVFVTRGTRSDAVLQARKAGLEFRPITHPNKSSVGAEVQFEALFDGAPLARQAITIHRGDERYAQKKLSLEVATDAQGRFTAKLDQPGVYLATTRHRFVAKDAVATAESHTYSVIFEVTE
jgi:uncharacterized GH25 family protein